MFTSDFLHTFYFAIPALCVVGASWCIIGYVMRNCPKNDISSSSIQKAGAFLSIVVCLLILAITRQRITSPASSTAIICIVYILSGVFNFSMLQFMSLSMQRGPSGIIWAIIQSALIFPFMGGVVFFGQGANRIQWLGILLIIFALFLFGASKNNHSTHERQPSECNWRVLAFCAFVCAALQQNMSTSPSYYPVTSGVPSIVRAMAVSLGTLIGCYIFNLFHAKSIKDNGRARSNYKRPIFWKYVLAVQFFALVTTYLLLFPSLDIMAQKGLGGAAYPLMVGSSIVSFTILAVCQFRERLRPLQVLGLIFCTAGLVAICLK